MNFLYVFTLLAPKRTSKKLALLSLVTAGEEDVNCAFQRTPFY